MSQRDEKMNFIYLCPMAQRDEKLNFTYRWTLLNAVQWHSDENETHSSTAEWKVELYLPLFNSTAEWKVELYLQLFNGTAGWEV